MKIFLDTANLDELRELVKIHPPTDKRLAQFQKDWAKPFQEGPVGR
ncbi:MAG: hypothetical protein ABSH56_23390 [Bryobacteraceae bacterium]